jgi:hypothetical protein
VELTLFKSKTTEFSAIKGIGIAGGVAMAYSKEFSLQEAHSGSQKNISFSGKNSGRDKQILITEDSFEYILLCATDKVENSASKEAVKCVFI